MKIITESTHPLIKRKELIFEVHHQKKPTPKVADVKKLAADYMKKDESLITIKSVKESFGSDKAIVKAYIYEDEKTKSRLEDVKKKSILAEKIKAQHEAKKKAMEASKTAEAPKQE